MNYICYTNKYYWQENKMKLWEQQEEIAKENKLIKSIDLAYQIEVNRVTLRPNLKVLTMCMTEKFFQVEDWKKRS